MLPKSNQIELPNQKIALPTEDSLKKASSPETEAGD
jgi:hypothetical protein